MRSPIGPGRWFEAIADHAGRAYLRYSFTRGTDQETDHLVVALGLEPGMRVLDVGCGPGRHARALASRGMDVVGVDVAETFLRVAREDPTTDAGRAVFVRADAHALPFNSAFDAAISLCQGGFGLAGDDLAIVRQMLGALRPGARAALTAFNAYFQVRWLEATDDFDAATGINHERTAVKDANGSEREFDLWTSCYTPKELALLVAAAGGVVERITAVGPGAYGMDAPDVEHVEFLVVMRRG
jgi:SAM-dependent methyltransferase